MIAIITSIMALHGIYGEDTQEACPLYNKENREDFLSQAPNMEKNSQKNKVKILHQFHSELEHIPLGCG
jgi:hypothetical protein